MSALEVKQVPELGTIALFRRGLVIGTVGSVIIGKQVSDLDACSRHDFEVESSGTGVRERFADFCVRLHWFLFFGGIMLGYFFFQLLTHLDEILDAAEENSCDLKRAFFGLDDTYE